MNRLIAALCLATGIAAVTGCAGGEQQRDHTSPMYSQGASYDAYYDNHYGPIYDGYWSGGNGGVFNYRTDPSQPFQQDTGGHFRTDPAPGYSEIRGQTQAPAPGGASSKSQPPQ